MINASKKSVILAVCLAAAVPAAAFTTRARLPAGNTVAPMKRPLVTRLCDNVQPDQDEADSQRKKKRADPTPALFSVFQDANHRNAMVASAALVTALSMAPLASDAAMSGGRMGGSSFSSRPSASRSYSAPSYSRGYSGGYSGGYYRPGLTIAPAIVSPFSPFYNPYSYGAPGVISYGRGPGLLPFLVLGGMALAVSNVVGSSFSRGASFFEERESDSVLGPGTSVLKLSVALNVADREDPNSLLGVLERLANTAKTDSRLGIQQLSSQVALEVLRRKASIVAGSSDYQHFRNRDKAQRAFNSLSVEERGKFEQETISKFGGVDYGSTTSRDTTSGGSKATVAVVTLVLAIDGDATKVPAIRSMKDIEDALRKIAADVKVSDCLQGSEILWTPQDPSETLSYRDAIADYPDLNAV